MILTRKNSMMSLRIQSLPLLTLLVVFSLSEVLGSKIIVENRCKQTVWVGALGNLEGGGKRWSIPLGGGFELRSGQSRELNVEVGWAGRVWGRTNCKGGPCETGTCADRVECNGLAGEPPATLAEFKMDGSYGLDNYDVSLVDGFNLPMRLVPPAGCMEGSCSHDMTSDCPKNLQKIVNGRVVACDSKFGVQEFRDYARQKCPNAYGYWNDDTKDYTCRPLSPGGSTYRVIFC